MSLIYGNKLNDDFVEQLAGLSFAQNEEGNWGYKPSGADSVIPFKTGSGNYEITITGNISAHFQSNVNRGYSAVTKTFVIVINIIDGVVSYSITTNPVGVGGTWVSLSDIYGSSVISAISGFSITNITIAPL